MCGVIGFYSRNWENVVPFAGVSAQFLQNRGGIFPQGVGFSDGRQVYTSPEAASEFFPKYFESPQRHFAIAGLRYGTEGSRTGENNIPPIEIEYEKRKLHICHNGQIPYSRVLRDWIESTTSYKHQRTTDTESLAAFLMKSVSEKGNIAEGAQELVAHMQDAAFSVVALLPDENTLVAIRDRNGYRPLYVYQNDDREMYAFASEDSALANNPFIDTEKGTIRKVNPGEVIVVNREGFKNYAQTKSGLAVIPTECKFENVYFARPDTHDASVAEDRVRLGKALHHLHPIDGNYHVIPDSESGDFAAMGYAHASGMPFYKATPKERHPIRLPDGTSLTQRSFMTFGDRGRQSLAGNRLRLSTLVAENDAFITDSVIRGTVIRKNLRLLHSMGAKNVHVRVTFPPTTDPCHQGIDFRGDHELIMRQIDPDVLKIYKGSDDIGRVNEEMRRWANDYTKGEPNVASFGYMTIEGFEQVVGKGCMRCLGREHDGSRYDGQIRLPPFLQDFTGKEYVTYFA